MNLINRNKRFVFYSTVLTAGLYLCFVILEKSNAWLYSIASLILYFVLLLEIYMDEKEHEVSIYYKSKILHHLFFPTIYYFGVIIFSYYNQTLNNYVAQLIISYFLFFLLFKSIWVNYRVKGISSKISLHLYDILSTIVYFYITVNLLYIFQDELVSRDFIFIKFFVFALTINSLLFLRYKYTKLSFVNLIFTFLISTLFIILVLININILISGIVIAVCFESFTSFLVFYKKNQFNYVDLLDILLILMLVVVLMVSSGN